MYSTKNQYTIYYATPLLGFEAIDYPIRVGE
jgi:hypothetical protein